MAAARARLPPPGPAHVAGGRQWDSENVKGNKGKGVLLAAAWPGHVIDVHGQGEDEPPSVCIIILA